MKKSVFKQFLKNLKLFKTIKKNGDSRIPWYRMKNVDKEDKHFKEEFNRLNEYGRYFEERENKIKIK